MEDCGFRQAALTMQEWFGVQPEKPSSRTATLNALTEFNPIDFLSMSFKTCCLEASRLIAAP